MILKKNLLKLTQILFLLLVVNNGLSAQVTIGSDVPPKATLDINPVDTASTAKGILIPRLTGDEIEGMTVGANQNSLLVYATSASTASNAIVNEIGFWYYDFTSTVWRPLTVARRKNIVNVKADGTGDYTTLQLAYDTESKKLYEPGNEFVLFVCDGDVGGLSATGAIPSIKIEGNVGSSIGTMLVYNSIVSFGGAITLTGNVTMINSFVKVPTTSSFEGKQLRLQKSFMETNKSLKLTNFILEESAFYITGPGPITFEPTANVTEGGTLLLKASTFKMGRSTVLNFQGSFSTSAYILCDDASFMSIQGTINAESPTSTIVLSRQESKVSLGSISGTAVPDRVLYALTGGKIEHINGAITMSSKEAAIVATTGGTISLGGDAFTASSSVFTNAGSATNKGVNAVGGNVIVNTPSGLATYTFNGYNYALSASAGGKVVSLGKIFQGTSTNMSDLISGVVNTTNGSVVYY